MLKSEGLLTMSAKEVDRAETIRRLLERRMSQKKAAEVLGVSARQVRRLRKAFKRDGMAGLASRRRGRPQ